jgi:hypothetical protein
MRTRLAAIALLVAALTAAGRIYFMFHAFPKGQILSVPAIYSGGRSSETFRVVEKATYAVGLEVDRVGDFRELVCAFGVEYPGLPLGYAQRGCPQVEHFHPVDLKWKISDGPSVVAVGSAAPGQYGEFGKTITRELSDEFTLNPGNYIINIEENDLSGVMRYNPRIVVHMSGYDILKEIDRLRRDMLVCVSIILLCGLFGGIIAYRRVLVGTRTTLSG